MLHHPVFDFLNIQTVWIVDGRVVLDDSRNFSTILLNEMGCPVADCTESLDNEGLVLYSRGEASHLGE